MEILSSILLTAAIYMAIPTLMTLFNGKIERKAAKIFSLWNSIIIGVIFFIASVGENVAWNASPAVLYYWINFMIMAKKETPEEKERRKKEKNTKFAQEITEDKLEDLNASKKKYTISIWAAIASLCLFVLSVVLLEQISEIGENLVVIVPVVLFVVCCSSAISFIVYRNRYADVYNQTLVEIPSTEDERGAASR